MTDDRATRWDMDPDVLPGIDAHIPNAARMYNYLLGGKDNLPADRRAAERLLTVAPEARELALRSRAFLHRAVRHLAADAGIRQFVDIGSGLPEGRTVHEVAAEADPGTRVAYVDNDPVVLAHSRAMSGATCTVTVEGDLRRPEEIMADDGLRSVIDLSEPVAILLVAVTHFLPDGDRPEEKIARLCDAVPPGSYLVMSHATDEERAGAAHLGASVYRGTNVTMTLRDRERIRELFDGFKIKEPGLVPLDDWHPEDEAPPMRGRDMPVWSLCGVGRSS
ncbi:SAM-dependent methyltransferase [Microbispora sp. NPDC049125]|uniref:SAM-dependent methyltransferase n=1 Tax=Microbispora sp. NPDC049125 TaxID=3154929 RepID=UPI003464F851